MDNPRHKLEDRKIWEMTLSDDSFQTIKSGQQTVEGRAWKLNVDYTKYQPGDLIEFTNTTTQEKLMVEVRSVAHYDTVLEMLRAEGFKNCEPNAESITDAVRAYNNIPEYQARITIGGIYAIRIKLVDQNPSM